MHYAAVQVNRPSGISQTAAIAVNCPQGVKDFNPAVYNTGNYSVQQFLVA